jgi:hypothetical protein
MEAVAGNFTEGDKGDQPTPARQAQADAAIGYRMTRAATARNPKTMEAS